MDSVKSPTTVWFTNCWEADYRIVLNPAFLASKLLLYTTEFDSRIVTINNVVDVIHARKLADYCVRTGVIDSYLFVKEHQTEAFLKLGISEDEVSRVVNFTNWMAVAICNTTCDYIVHCAADVTFSGNRDWVSHGIHLLGSNPTIIMVTPKSVQFSELECEQALHNFGSHWLHPGVTDTCFVLCRKSVCKPIYNAPRLGPSMFPLSEFGACWEERLDAYIRSTGMCRAILTDVSWKHWGNLGASYPRWSILDRLKKRLQRP